jgi:DNA helicase-2/ATP-dependent DNA helicase PcrA
MAIDDAAILAQLDPDQLAVVKAITGPVCVIAGAGTGKTRVITNRIAYAINSGVTDPTKVLALTFTAKAAGEMRARLRSLGVPNATARTFHSAALKQLLYFWPYAFGGQFPSLLTTKSGLSGQRFLRSLLIITKKRRLQITDWSGCLIAKVNLKISPWLPKFMKLMNH